MKDNGKHDEARQTQKCLNTFEMRKRRKRTQRISHTMNE